MGSEDVQRVSRKSMEGNSIMKLIDILRVVLNYRNTELEDLARNIAWYDLAKAEKLQFFLEVHIREETEKRLKWKDAA